VADIAQHARDRADAGRLWSMSEALSGIAITP
jgi:hypothetical protein